MKRIVIVGATSAIAEACAKRWLAQAPAKLVLLGRDRERLARVAADLKVRSPESVCETLVSDFLDPAAIERTVGDAWARHDGADVVLIAHGNLPDQKQCQREIAACRDAVEVNGVSPVLFAEAFASKLEQAGVGSMAVIGSVAGDRGRRSNYAYGAAKGLVDRFVQGMQHRFAGTGVRVVLVKPGPTDTPMTAHLKGGGTKLASVDDVAEAIVNGVDKGLAVVYAPAKWRIIMMVIRHLPRMIFNRLDI